MSAELAKFEATGKALLRKIGKYAASGGDALESTANRKTELSLFKARDKLEDSMRPLGLTDNPRALALLGLVKEAASLAPGLAAAKRAEIRNAQLKELDSKAREHRAWRIENGLEDPPRRY
jgi:hypothetical protein